MNLSRYYMDRLIGLIALGIVTWAVFAAVTGPGRAAYATAAAQNSDLQSLKDRLARQLDLAQGENAESAGLSSDFVWPGTDRAGLERQLQERILEAAKAANLTLTSFGPAPGPSDLAAGTIAYTLEGSAGWEDALKFTAGLSQIKPPLAVGELSLRTGAINPAQPNPQIGLRLVLWGLAPEIAGDGT